MTFYSFHLKIYARPDEADIKLPGAIRVPADEVEQHLRGIPRDRVVITYCT